MNNKKLTDENLILQVAANDISAFEELYARYSVRILNYFFRMLGSDRDKAQDFLQDVFIKLLEKAHLFDEKEKFSTWIYTMSHNMCRNEYRYQNVRIKAVQNGKINNGSLQECDSVTTEENIDLKLIKSALYAEVEKLDDNHRSTFILRYQGNMSIKEISSVLNCSEGTTKSRLYYTTRDLMTKLKDYNPFQEG